MAVAQKTRSTVQRNGSQVMQKQNLLNAVVTPQQVHQVIQSALQMVIGDLAYSRIIESYKIEFEYEGTAIMASFGSSDVPSSSSTAAFTARSPMAVRELREAILPFLYSIATAVDQAQLAELPSSKYLEIKLDFNDKASSDYRLPNFAPYTRELWMRTPNHQVPLNIACGRMNTAAKETALSSKLLRNIPDVGPVATYPFGPQEIGVADLPGVRGIFGRFEERIGPWDKFEVRQLGILPDAPLVSSKPVPLRQAAETKKTHIAKKAGSRQPGVTSSLREREIKKQTELLKDKQKQVHTPKSNAASAVKTAGPAPPTLAKSTAPLFGALNLLHCDAVMNRA
ncbi:hypothetical protein CcaverHIS002_0209450 [Cutaneotrichosporon cavernicola]|nr:hypothetical protein CcaverHIS002_0209450 [Cutaneotrichosporon cavernicola]